MAPATEASSTSLTEHPSALPTAFTSSSDSGSFHATTLEPDGSPFRLVTLSFSISAMAAASFATWVAMRAYSPAASPSESGSLSIAL